MHLQSEQRRDRAPVHYLSLQLREVQAPADGGTPQGRQQPGEGEEPKLVAATAKGSAQSARAAPDGADYRVEARTGLLKYAAVV